MPESSQFQFTIAEMTRMLIREQGITSGHWEAHFGFNTIGGAINLAGQVAYPSIVAQITTVILQRVVVPTPLSIDAGTMQFESFPESL